MEPFFDLENVSVAARGNHRPLLTGITLAVGAGERWAVVGTSGAGKSTLLRLLNRMVDPSSGTVRIQGTPAAEIPPSRLRREVALVFQEPVWLPGSARDNLLASRALGIITGSEAEERLGEVLGQIGLEPGLLDRGEDELSVGERQRVVLGRALMTRPHALLLDEPTASLDPPTARSLLSQIQRLGKSQDLTVIVVTHRLEDARQFGSRCAVIDRGRLVEQGDAGEILDRLESRWNGIETDAGAGPDQRR